MIAIRLSRNSLIELDSWLSLSSCSKLAVCDLVLLLTLFPSPNLPRLGCFRPGLYTHPQYTSVLCQSPVHERMAPSKRWENTRLVKLFQLDCLSLTSSQNQPLQKIHGSTQKIDFLQEGT